MTDALLNPLWWVGAFTVTLCAAAYMCARAESIDDQQDEGTPVQPEPETYRPDAYEIVEQSVLIVLPNGRFVRVTELDAKGVTADGETWDGTMSFGPHAQRMIDHARRNILNVRSAA